MSDSWKVTTIEDDTIVTKKSGHFTGWHKYVIPVVSALIIIGVLAGVGILIREIKYSGFEGKLKLGRYKSAYEYYIDEDNSDEQIENMKILKDFIIDKQYSYVKNPSEKKLIDFWELAVCFLDEIDNQDSSFYDDICNFTKLEKKITVGYTDEISLDGIGMLEADFQYYDVTSYYHENPDDYHCPISTNVEFENVYIGKKQADYEEKSKKVDVMYDSVAVLNNEDNDIARIFTDYINKVVDMREAWNDGE